MFLLRYAIYIFVQNILSEREKKKRIAVAHCRKLEDIIYYQETPSTFSKVEDPGLKKQYYSGDP